MPIIACPQCTTNLQVKDGMAGRQVRCPRCQTIVTVPNNTPTPSAPPQNNPSAPPTSPVSGMPGSHLQDPQREMISSDPTNLQPPPQPTHPAPHTFSQETTPVARKGFPVLLVSLVAVGVLMLGGIGFGVVYFLSSWSTGSVDLAYLPDDPDFVVNIQVEQIRKSEGYKKLLDEFPQLEEKSEEFLYLTGVDWHDTKSIQVSGFLESGPTFLFRTSKDYTPEDITRNIGKKAQDEVEVEGYTIYNNPRGSFCLINPTKILFGKEEIISEILERNGPAEIDSRFLEIIRQIDFSKSIAFASKSQGERQLKQSLRITGLDDDMFVPLLELLPKYSSLEINLSEKISYKGVSYYEKSEPAEDMKEISEGFWALLGRFPMVPDD